MLFEQNCTYRLICYSLGYDDLEAGRVLRREANFFRKFVDSTI